MIHKKILIAGLILSGYVAHVWSDITLKALDKYARQSTTFNVAIPWTLEIALEDIAEIKDRPQLKGLEHAYVRESSTMTMSVNGRTTIKYSYKVRFDVAGTYTIGPAVIEKNGKTYRSNSITVTVVDQPAQESESNKSNESSVLFVRMKTDKEQVVVGEKFKCTLRCYFRDQVTQFAPSSSMQIPGFVFEDGVQQANGVETIKGVHYNYFEITWNAHAIEPGKKNIPAYEVDYIVQINPYGGHASAFANLIGQSFGERRRAHSNTITMTVQDLPAHNGPVHGVGAFTHFGMRIDPVVAKQGEGMVLTLELEGQGTLRSQGLELQSVPEQLKWYDSKQYEDKKNQSKKYFEFIVQGLEQGQWNIGHQQFTFFDTRTRSYKTLYTQPLSIKIMAHAGLSQQALQMPAAPSQSAQSQEESSDDIRPFIVQDVTDTKIPALPSWLMILLCLVPLGYIAYPFIMGYLSGAKMFKKKNVFTVARTHIKHACAKQQPAMLYGIFVRLVADLSGSDVHTIDQECIARILQARGMAPHDIDEWNGFYTLLSELMFCNKQLKLSECMQLQHTAYRWIDTLEKVL
jgi:hypothetical protein